MQTIITFIYRNENIIFFRDPLLPISEKAGENGWMELLG